MYIILPFSRKFHQKITHFCRRKFRQNYTLFIPPPLIWKLWLSKDQMKLLFCPIAAYAGSCLFYRTMPYSLSNCELYISISNLQMWLLNYFPIYNRNWWESDNMFWLIFNISTTSSYQTIITFDMRALNIFKRNHQTDVLLPFCIYKGVTNYLW